MSGPVIYYDGACGLCDRFVRFVLARDRRAAFRFATLEGPLGARARAAAGEPPRPGAEARTVLVDAGDGRWLRKSRAVAFVLARLGGPWRVLAGALRILPAALADLGYDVVARLRYRLFGRVTACALPRPEWRARFLDEA
jgi:predicted DCC family thiol-disulfide oxidoreductase YuxK